MIRFEMLPAFKFSWTLLLTGLISSVHGKSWPYGSWGEPVTDLDARTLPPDEWFAQKLDHFNAGPKVFWNQRYRTNQALYKPGGPVFLMIGAEGETSASWMSAGAWYEYAQKYNAMLFQLEHRFYGQSHPTEDVSVENLRTLSSQQALADLAWFIRGMRRKYELPKETKWIAFGGSYAGSLAAWLRYKYPHLVYGAISSSAPLLAKADFFEYYDSIKESIIRESGYDCADTITQAANSIYNKWRNGTERSYIDDKFHLCDPLEGTVQDLWNLNYRLFDSIAEVVQYNKVNRKLSWDLTIDTMCDILTDTQYGGPLLRLAALNANMAEQDERDCLEVKYDTMIEKYKNTSWEGPEASRRIAFRSWTYQTCTEFGYFQSSGDPQKLLGSNFPSEFWQRMCTDLYGPEFDEKLLNDAIDETNTMYGALSLNVNHVVFVQGMIDPWHVLGMTKMNHPGVKVIVMNGTAHCAEMYPESDDDPPELKQARVDISEAIGSWLDEPHQHPVFDL